MRRIVVPVIGAHRDQSPDIINQINRFMKNSIGPNRDSVSRLTGCGNQELHHARIDALDTTAYALEKIIRQHELTDQEGEKGLRDIEAAINSAEDALFYLASASTINDMDKTRELLREYGRGDLLP